MNDLLARELAHVLKKNGIESDINIEGATEIQLNIEQIATISPSGALTYPPPKNEDLDLKQVVEKLAPILAEVREYTYLLEKASDVQSNSGNGDYKQLAEFKGAILAAKDVGEYGVQFATWELDGSGTGYTFGHYFGDDYASAKTDFALRSGLIQKGRYFTEEQLVEMYRCMQDTLDGNYELHPEQEQIITETCNQIQGALPNLLENIANSEQKLREWQEQGTQQVKPKFNMEQSM